MILERKKVALWENGEIPFYDKELEYGENVEIATLTPFLLNNGKEHAAVIVFPGGGYTHRSEKESEPVAKYLNAIGLHAFILNYRVIPYPPYLGSVDGKRAVRYVRAHAEEYHILENKIGVIGFSAGAGNACMAAELYDKSDYEQTDEIDKVSARPDFCIFCYGALSLKTEYMSEKDFTIFESLVPEEDREAFIRNYSCDLLVRENMPPVFVWHALDDERVDAGVCLDFVKAMHKAGNDVECHLFPVGGHGGSVTESKNVVGLNQWFSLLENWLARKGFLYNNAGKKAIE